MFWSIINKWNTIWPAQHKPEWVRAEAISSSPWGEGVGPADGWGVPQAASTLPKYKTVGDGLSGRQSKYQHILIIPFTISPPQLRCATSLYTREARASANLRQALVGDGVLDAPRDTLQCRFYNIRGELRSPAWICTLSQHKTVSDPIDWGEANQTLQPLRFFFANPKRIWNVNTHAIEIVTNRHGKYTKSDKTPKNFTYLLKCIYIHNNLWYHSVERWCKN